MFHVSPSCFRCRTRGGREQRGRYAPLTEEEQEIRREKIRKVLQRRRKEKTAAGKKSYNKGLKGSGYGALSTLKAAARASR